MVIFCLLIPVHAIALPLYLMLAKLGLTNTYAALVIPWTISVFGIFLMRQFFMTVPDDLINAARMDGMSEFSIIWKVMLPTAIPALLAFAILFKIHPVYRDVLYSTGVKIQKFSLLFLVVFSTILALSYCIPIQV